MAETLEILIATSNPGKFREIVAVLEGEEGGPDEARDSGRRIRWRCLAQLPAAIPEPIEDGATFAENAAKKAIHYSTASGLITLADDSGLEVDALDGAPGVRSARYAGLAPDAPREQSDRANNAKLIAALADVPPERRTARFRCALALAQGDRVLATAEGVIEGVIIDVPRGSNGFGYDPHFRVPSIVKTTAELAPDEKNRISHRGQALRAMAEKLKALPALLGD